MKNKIISKNAKKYWFHVKISANNKSFENKCIIILKMIVKTHSFSAHSHNVMQKKNVKTL